MAGNRGFQFFLHLSWFSVAWPGLKLVCPKFGHLALIGIQVEWWVCKALIPATHGNLFILSQPPPVPWSSGGLQILSREGNPTKPASLASVHHMCSRAAQRPASCSPTIMLSDDGWLHIRCLNWQAAPSGKWFGKSGLAWWMGKVTMPIRVTLRASLLLPQQPPSLLSHWSTFFPFCCHSAKVRPTVTKLSLNYIINPNIFLARTFIK